MCQIHTTVQFRHKTTTRNGNLVTENNVGKLSDVFILVNMKYYNYIADNSINNNDAGILSWTLLFLWRFTNITSEHSKYNIQWPHLTFDKQIRRHYCRFPNWLFHIYFKVVLVYHKNHCSFYIHFLYFMASWLQFIFILIFVFCNINTYHHQYLRIK